MKKPPTVKTAQSFSMLGDPTILPVSVYIPKPKKKVKKILVKTFENNTPRAEDMEDISLESSCEEFDQGQLGQVMTHVLSARKTNIYRYALTKLERQGKLFKPLTDPGIVTQK